MFYEDRCGLLLEACSVNNATLKNQEKCFVEKKMMKLTIPVEQQVNRSRITRAVIIEAVSQEMKWFQVIEW